MAKQSHNLRINIGSLKPDSGQARVIATGAPSSGNVDRTNVNHNPKPGSAAPNVSNLNGTRTPKGKRPA